jgi:hypothetical protein
MVRSSDSKSWEEATQMITIGMEDEIFRRRRLHQHFGGEDTFTLKRLDHVVSRMIMFRDCEYVDGYLCTSPETKLFYLASMRTNSQVAIYRASNVAIIFPICDSKPNVW